MNAERLKQQYAIQAAAADRFHAKLGQRWAVPYLNHRGLTEPATAAHAGYASSRPGQWTLLLDHLRTLVSPAPRSTPPAWPYGPEGEG